MCEQVEFAINKVIFLAPKRLKNVYYVNEGMYIYIHTYMRYICTFVEVYIQFLMHGS